MTGRCHRQGQSSTARRSRSRDPRPKGHRSAGHRVRRPLHGDHAATAPPGRYGARLAQRARTAAAPIEPRQPRRRDAFRAIDDRAVVGHGKSSRPVRPPGLRRQRPPAVQHRTDARTGPLRGSRTSARPHTAAEAPSSKIFRVPGASIDATYKAGSPATLTMKCRPSGRNLGDTKWPLSWLPGKRLESAGRASRVRDAINAASPRSRTG